MCNFASFVLTKKNVYYIENSDSHEDIIEFFNLRDKEVNLVRVELLPPIDLKGQAPSKLCLVGEFQHKDIQDVSKWKFEVDQDEYPDWTYKGDPTLEEKARRALVKRIKEQKIGVKLEGGFACKIEGGHFAHVNVGKIGRAIVGDYGIASSGDGGFSIAGKYGKAISGDSGTSYVLAGGESISGTDGTALSTGFNVKATAGNFGKAVVESYGTAKVGNFGTAIGATESIAIAGNYGDAITGIRGSAQAGLGGRIQIGYMCGLNSEIKIGYIGEKGLKPNVLYCVNPKTKRFCEVKQSKKGNK